MWKALTIVAAAVAAAGCAPSADIGIAEDAAQRFHMAYNEGRYDRLYAEATDDLRRSTTREAWTALLAANKERVGNFRSATRTGFNIAYTNGVTSVGLSFATQFERGARIEQFVYRLEDGGPRLAGYQYRLTDNAPPDRALPPPPGRPANGAAGD